MFVHGAKQSFWTWVQFPSSPPDKDFPNIEENFTLPSTGVFLCYLLLFLLVSSAMEIDPREPLEKIQLCLVGENRSNTAQERDWSWEGCQKEKRPRLCAIQLFNALECCDIDPYDTERVRFLNLWDDKGDLDEQNIQEIQAFLESGYAIVGMGKNVQKALSELSIEHVQIIHPAARGQIRKKGAYIQHILAVFQDEGMISRV